MNCDVDVGEHMRMVPQPLFHSKPAAIQHGQTISRYDSASGSVSPFQYRQHSDTNSSMQSQQSGIDRFPSTPYRLSIDANDRRRSSIGTIPISPRFQYSDNAGPYSTAMQAAPQTRANPQYRRYSDENRVSAYWHIPTKGGSNELVFRRSKEKHPLTPKITGPGSPSSPGVPLLAPDIVAQRLQTPEATPEHSPLLQRPWNPAQHATSYSTASSLPSPSAEEEEDPSAAGNNSSSSSKPPKELTAKQALLARFTKGAVKYADKLTRPTGYEPRSSSPLSTNTKNSDQTSNNNNNNNSSAHVPIARTESPHLLPSPTNPTATPTKPPAKVHAKKPSLGWSAATKSAFDSHHNPSSSRNHSHKPTPSQTSIYTHISTPPRPLDKRSSSGGNYDEEASTAHSSVRRSSINLFATLRDLRRETRAEKRREEIKKSIRVVGVPEGAAAGFGSEVRGRSADGRGREVDERPQVGGGGLGGCAEC
jgi:hypothetical protein